MIQESRDNFSDAIPCVSDLFLIFFSKLPLPHYNSTLTHQMLHLISHVKSINYYKYKGGGRWRLSVFLRVFRVFSQPEICVRSQAPKRRQPYSDSTP